MRLKWAKLFLLHEALLAIVLKLTIIFLLMYLLVGEYYNNFKQAHGLSNIIIYLPGYGTWILKSGCAWGWDFILQSERKLFYILALQAAASNLFPHSLSLLCLQAALVTKVRSWKMLRCPPTDEWIINIWNIIQL